MEQVKAYKAELGIPLSDEDRHETGMLGEDYTPITTTIGESAVYYETVYRWPLTLVGAAAAVGLLLWGRHCRRREEET